MKERKIDSVVVTHLGQKFTIVDYNGFQYNADVVAIDKRFDLCLLRVNTVLTKPPVLKISKDRPKRGQLAYNMAAPHGIVFPRMVMTFDGYFTGYSPEGYAMYSMPTKPGSSGSPIVNSNNELIGNIFAGYRSMENIGVASPLLAIKVFLRNSIAKAEMQVWQKLNNNQDKTDSTMIKMMQNMHNNLHEYFNIGEIKERYIKQDEFCILRNFFGRPLWIDMDQRENVLVNNFIQSSAVDLSLKYFAQITEKLNPEYFKPLYVIHDALVVDVKKEYKQKVEDLINLGYNDKELGNFPLNIEQV